MPFKKLYSDHLIPASQLVELLSRAPLRPHSSRRRDHFVCSVQDTLNLAALWARTATPAAVKLLNKRLGDLTGTLVKVLRPPRAMVAATTGDCEKTLTDKTPSALAYSALLGSVKAPGTDTKPRTNIPRVDLADAWGAHIQGELRFHLEAVHTLLGYQPTMRGQWLSERRTSTNPWANRPSSWRTLARNSSWETTLKLLGIESAVPAHVHLEDIFGSHPGKMALSTNWALALPGSKPDSSTPELAADETLPPGVTVTTNAGVLFVQATLEPLKLLGPAVKNDIQALGAGPETKELRNLLAPRMYSARTPWRQLPDAMATLQAWVRSQHKDVMALVPKIEALKSSARLGELKKRLESEFSAEDRRLLQQLLSTEAAASAPAKKAAAKKTSASKVKAAAPAKKATAPRRTARKTAANR